MTLEEIEKMQGGTIPPRVAAEYLGVTPYLLNIKAREGKLEFPAFFSGNRLKILREPFINYCKRGGRPNDA